MIKPFVTTGSHDRKAFETASLFPIFQVCKLVNWKTFVFWYESVLSNSQHSTDVETHAGGINHGQQ